MNVARRANARNNASEQRERAARWSCVRDEVWRLTEPLVSANTRVLIVGAGNGDDVPLQRVLDTGAHVTLADIDPSAMARATRRVTRASRSRLDSVSTDVTQGVSSQVLDALTRGHEPTQLRRRPAAAIVARSSFDLVIGDMLYTQLLHAGLVASDLPSADQRAVMQAFDPLLTRQLVLDLEASTRPGGHVLHLHDVACWTKGHTQPLALDVVLADPESRIAALRRHDACDPHMHCLALGRDIRRTAWWHWPFNERADYLVRASLVRTDITTGRHRSR